MNNRNVLVAVCLVVVAIAAVGYAIYSSTSSGSNDMRGLIPSPPPGLKRMPENPNAAAIRAGKGRSMPGPGGGAPGGQPPGPQAASQ